MSNEQNTTDARDRRTGYAQTAYKRTLAFARLGIDPASVPCVPYFRVSLTRIARSLNHPRVKPESHARLIRPFDCLQSTDHPEALKVSRVYQSVPASYRRLLPPEAFCVAAGVDPIRVLEVIAAGAARQTGQASAIIAALWHPQVVLKTVERALQDAGTRERAMLHKAVGFLSGCGYERGLRSIPAFPQCPGPGLLAVVFAQSLSHAARVWRGEIARFVPHHEQTRDHGPNRRMGRGRCGKRAMTKRRHR